MRIERHWSMPSRWTFEINPIRDLLYQEMGEPLFIKGLWVDPFAGRTSWAQITNDLNPEMNTQYNMTALDFLKQLNNDCCDGVLFDPPYSPRQVMECYNGLGLDVTSEETKQSFYSDAKNEIARILKHNGKVICFGWNSNGLGINRGFIMNRILMVAHGGTKNDTIVTVEVKN